MSDRPTPMTDALFTHHCAEARNMRPGLALAQVRELLDHARRMEGDRAELISALHNVCPMLESFCKGDPRAVLKLDAIRAALAKVTP